jgi:DNA replication factor GINS
MITQLKQALSKEKMVGEYQISTLDPHFYIKLKESMTELNKDDFDKVESMMLELFRMRRGKLVKIADSIKLNSELYNKLTVEESIFYKTIHDNSVEFEKQIRGERNEHGTS